MFVLVAAQAAMLRFAKIGFLCSMESLLSTAGKEQSMLKDVQGVVELIKHSFSFRIQKRTPSQLQESIQIVKNDKRKHPSAHTISLEPTPSASAGVPDRVTLLPRMSRSPTRPFCEHPIAARP